MITLFKKFDHLLHQIVPPRFAKLARYLFAGGTAAAVNLGSLFILTSILHVWYLTSAILAFLVAFVVSFILQKMWTFGDRNTDKIKSQAITYFIVTSCNLGLNTLSMYLLVDHFSIHYMLAQVITGVFIATESFFVYQKFVFHRKPITQSTD